MTQRPSAKPQCPNFSSGPCAKRPGYQLSALDTSAMGRSHRSKIGKARISQVLTKTAQLLQQNGMPADYLVGLVPGSDTGAVEMMMWSILGELPVTIAHWESFGAGWLSDATKQLNLQVTNLSAPYGELPALQTANFDGDVVFTWNGTTSGVCVPNGDWIPANRTGLTICDATSGVFAQNLPWEKLDVVTFSWQKCLGGEGAHGMLVLSPRAVARLESGVAMGRGLPKIFRLTNGGKLIAGVFKDSPINTPSMLAVEDQLDALNWALSVGGYAGLVERANTNARVLASFVEKNDWVSFLAKEEAFRSNTSVCLVINDLEAGQIKQLQTLLDRHSVAFDIGSYRDAPVGLRIWCGPTVETKDLAALTEWLSWAHGQVKSGSIRTMNIIATDGLATGAVEMLEAAGHTVTKQFLEKEQLLAGDLAAYDAIILRSATKLPAAVIDAIGKRDGNKLKVICRAGVGVDNIDLVAATRNGLPVLNAPRSATHSVVELALGHMLSSARHIARATADLKAKKWTKSSCTGHELRGKHLGFVGFGRIGQALAAVCQLLGMTVHYYDPYLPATVAEAISAATGAQKHETLQTMFKSCTHITVHAMLTPETRHIINYELVALMPGVSPAGIKCGNHLISCARGGVVDEEGMLQALQEDKLGSLALDVFENEPLGDSPLLDMAQFSGTPHIGASTIEAQDRVGAEIATALIEFFDGDLPAGNLVNKDVQAK